MKIRLKKKVKVSLYIIFILAIIGCMANTFFYGKSQVKKKRITYSKESSVNYVTYLKDNNHYSDQFLKDNYNYVASLIDYFNVDFNYSYVLDEAIKYKLDYEVVANLEIFDADNKSKPIDTKEFTILKKHTETGKSQLIKVDLYNQIIKYDDYNRIIQGWKKEITPEATLKVKFKVNWKGYSDSLNREVSENYVKEFNIPISDKIITISKPSTDKTNGMLYAKQTLGSWFLIIMGSFGILLVIGFIGLIDTIIKINKNRSKYEQEINRILRRFDRAITEAKEQFIKYKDENYIEVNNFMELLDVHDNLNEPIIYYKNSNKSSIFAVRNNKDVYYVLIERDEYE